MKTRNIIAFVLIIISLICLYPGLTKNILSIDVGTNLPLLGKVSIHKSTQSIMKTIQTLHKNNNTLVAFLILLFSVVVPILKALILLIILFFKQLPIRNSLHKFVGIIGKWSMADVFVVGVFLAFLATGSNENISAKIHDGFYYFLAYCIISVLAIQIMKIEQSKELV